MYFNTVLFYNIRHNKILIQFSNKIISIFDFVVTFKKVIEEINLNKCLSNDYSK